MNEGKSAKGIKESEVWYQTKMKILLGRAGTGQRGG